MNFDESSQKESSPTEHGGSPPRFGVNNDTPLTESHLNVDSLQQHSPAPDTGTDRRTAASYQGGSNEPNTIDTELNGLEDQIHQITAELQRLKTKALKEASDPFSQERQDIEDQRSRFKKDLIDLDAQHRRLCATKVREARSKKNQEKRQNEEIRAAGRNRIEQSAHERLSSPRIEEAKNNEESENGHQNQPPMRFVDPATIFEEAPPPPPIPEETFHGNQPTGVAGEYISQPRNHAAGIADAEYELELLRRSRRIALDAELESIRLRNSVYHVPYSVAPYIGLGYSSYYNSAISEQLLRERVALSIYGYPYRSRIYHAPRWWY